ncbi:MAG: 2-(1,2-epoxy-1,2-dihydrophenyl)acetyl-CoA isomerase PaaG [Candidatus Abyssubacteria bacterium]
MELFAKHLTAVAWDDSILGVVVTGEGKAFCAGGDLRWALAHRGGPAIAFHELSAQYHQAIMEIRRMRKPVIAAINGVAAGGGFSLAMACDLRVMAKSAVMKQAYTSAGLCIDGGGTYSLPRLVGLARAMEIVAFDKPISSEHALAWGLATKLTEDGRALEESMGMARELTQSSVNSFGWCKELLMDSFNTAFEAQLERERLGLSLCASHADGREGLQAFSEKRTPAFNPRPSN